MRKTLVALGLFTLLTLCVQATFAACPCARSSTLLFCRDVQRLAEASNPCPCPCDCAKEPCCEDWLNCKCVEDYFCRIGLSECQSRSQKSYRTIQMRQFKCLRVKRCNCESKCECREYRRALKDLDCKMKNLITKCQKSDYRCACEAKLATK